ncbi:MAG: NADP-dependent oxidoreductase [Acidobacteria bacterium]|nr:NADP-dependent oxidoreductase [Acidobacteriota bacterium]
MTNQGWVLETRPVEKLDATCLAWREVPLPAVGAGSVRVKTLMLSLDPTNRIWAGPTESYLPPVPLGTVMRGIAVGVVEESQYAGLQVGDVVQGMMGWKEHAVLPGVALTLLPKDVTPEQWFGVFGHIGLTAYFGLLEVGQAKAGETLVVSAAAGAVGSLVGQIGKILGMRVVGIAGGPEKCKWIVEELGFDAAIDYKNEEVGKRLRELCPDGIDVDFEKVGGEIMDACLARLGLRGRVVLCGMISQYNATSIPEGPKNLANVLMQRGGIEGFIVLDYLGRAGEAFGKLGEWLATGKLQFATDVVVGLENAPTALDRLFIGANRGKLMVKVADNG